MRPCVPSLAGAAILLAIVAAPAWADPAADSGPMATAVHDETQAKIDSWLADSAADAREDDLGGCLASPLPDGKMHGEVGASIGTGGYRSVYGVVQIPIGKQADKGAVTLAYSQSRGRGWYGREAFGGPHAFGPGYGSGPFGVVEPTLAGRPCGARLARSCLAERDPCASPLR